MASSDFSAAEPKASDLCVERHQCHCFTDFSEHEGEEQQRKSQMTRQGRCDSVCVCVRVGARVFAIVFKFVYLCVSLHVCI